MEVEVVTSEIGTTWMTVSTDSTPRKRPSSGEKRRPFTQPIWVKHKPSNLVTDFTTPKQP